MLTTMWNNCNPYILEVRMQNDTVTLENSLAVSYKIKQIPTMQPSNPTDGNNLVNNPDVLEWTGEWVVYPHNGIIAKQ